MRMLTGPAVGVIDIRGEHHSAMRRSGNASAQVFDIYKTYRFLQKTYGSRGGVMGIIGAIKERCVMSLGHART
jgi:hypothetical protein